MAINYNPFSQFNVEPSSFSLPAGMTMNQAATTNAMMQPVSLLGQQSFGAPQQAFQFEEEEEDLFERNLLSGLASVGAAVEKSKSPPVTYRNYDFPEPPRASALSVFTQGGDLKPGIDVNAITPSPQASPSLYAINTALNQEVPFESQISSGPDFSGMDVSLSPFTAAILDSLKRGVTQPQFGIMGFDPSQNPYGETLTEGLNKTPTAIPMGPEMEESISPFLQSPDTPSGLGGQLLDGFNRVNDSFREPNAPMGRDETRAMLQERFGAPTINAILNLPSGQGMGTGIDEQGRMVSEGDSRAAFDQASLDRLARLEERDLLQGETQTQRDTRLAESRTEGAGNVPSDVLEAINTPSSRRSLKQIRRISKWESSEQGKAMGGVSGLIEERDQFNPRVVEIDGVKLIQLSPTYFQPVRPEPLPGEDFVPRRETVEGFTYLEVSPNKFERVPAEPNSNPVVNPDPLTTGTTNQLDEKTARAILTEAGGDVEEARRIAKERGFVL